MSLPQLFYCEKLRARISLLSCEANRKKGTGRYLSGNPIRPKACDDCQDWRAWEQRELSHD